jgi:hypothetical protein
MRVLAGNGLKLRMPEKLQIHQPIAETDEGTAENECQQQYSKYLQSLGHG